MEIYPIPPSDFCKRLYELDPNLSLNWDPSHGVWSIWYNDRYTGLRDHVMNVMEPDGSYRPLDERTIKIIKMNHYYAQHPDELIKAVIDPIEQERVRADAKDEDNARHFGNDSSLKKHWDKVVEMARSVPWEQWATPREFQTRTGETLTWMPDASIRNQSKPTELDADVILRQEDRK